MKKSIKTVLLSIAIAAGIAVTAAGAYGAVVLGSYYFATSNDPNVFISPPVSEILSDEAREGCLALGMSAEEIEADQNACLTSYWTQERLYRSDRTLVDYYADIGLTKECWKSVGFEITCEGIGGWLSGYPDADDPWWDAQPTRDPGRTSVPEGQEMPELREW